MNQLEGRRTLLVLDDVWHVDHADVFSASVPPAGLLLTTRNRDVLVGLDAEEHRVDLQSASDALEMLAEWAGAKSLEKLPLEAVEVTMECGYLPLALAMIGALIRSKRSRGHALSLLAWQDALTRLSRADLAAIKRAFPGYPYPNLLRAIEVSIEALESADRERYLDLAMFPEDQPIPEEPLYALWNLDEVDTRDCMTRLVARSLATWARSEASLILHDLQRDVIHKQREKELPGLHLRLVEAWDALPKLNSYAWRRVAYHLVQSGREDDLRRLLLNFNYLEAKLAATDPNALIADFDYTNNDEELRLIHDAIRLSAHMMVRHPRQLAGQLTGRLLGNTSAGIQGLLKQAAQRRNWAWLRPVTRTLTVPGGPLIRTLEGNTSSVRTVAVTPDGRRAVSGSADGTLRLWDLESGQIIRAFEDQTGDSILAVAVTPDGRRALSGSWDGRLRLWDLESGEIIDAAVRGHGDRIMTVAVMPDGRRALSGSDDQTLRLWDLESGEIIREPEGHTDSVMAIAVTQDGCCALSGSADGTLRLWDLKSGETIRELEGHTPRVMAVAVTPDGRRALSGSTNGTLWLWDLESGQTIDKLEGHTDSVTAVAVMPDGLRAVSGSWDRMLRLWDLRRGEMIRTLQGHTGGVVAVATTSDGRRAVSGSWDHTLRLWDLESGETIRTFVGHTGEVYVVAITPDGRRAVSGSADRMVRLWDLESGQTIRKLEGHTDSVTAVTVTLDGRHAVSTSRDQTLRLWDLESGDHIATFIGESEIESCAVGSDARTLVAREDSGQVHFLRIVEADETKPLPSEIKISLLIRAKQSTNKPNEPSILMLPAQARVVFISYAHADNEGRNPKERWLDRFIEFLQPLVSQENLTLCSDQDIQIGDRWHELRCRVRTFGTGRRAGAGDLHSGLARQFASRISRAGFGSERYENEGKLEPPHRHKQAFEFQYMTAGLTAYLDLTTAEEHVFRKGDFYVIEPGAVYAQKSAPGTEILFIKVPPGNDKVPVDITPEVEAWFREPIKE